MRSAMIASVLAAMASAFLLYSVSYDTRKLAREAARLERKIEVLRGDLSILKAERAHLARPERIEPMARAMGLRPVQGHQMIVPRRAAVLQRQEGDGS